MGERKRREEAGRPTAAEQALAETEDSAKWDAMTDEEKLTDILESGAAFTREDLAEYRATVKHGPNCPCFNNPMQQWEIGSSPKCHPDARGVFPKYIEKYGVLVIECSECRNWLVPLLVAKTGKGSREFYAGMKCARGGEHDDNGEIYLAQKCCKSVVTNATYFPENGMVMLSCAECGKGFALVQVANRDESGDEAAPIREPVASRAVGH